MDIGIGELSKITGIKVPTIRYYEQIGLLSEGSRNKGNQRRYGSDAVCRLRFIRNARELGFHVVEIRELCRLAEIEHLSPLRSTMIARKYLNVIRAKLSELTVLEENLKRMVEDRSTT
ncbi:MerR family transcriptional regulator [Brucella tritici]|uniref:MerR family transcriptional regulator n=1 Tax=Brucella tritici TaxID=94626 RepID=A0A6L3YN58_9HYPH|nr:MerR family transcriptional regulator [Brucella tritici]KAB2684381.1 MerR family transcriptional regulator [Brucella tritici]